MKILSAIQFFDFLKTHELPVSIPSALLDAQLGIYEVKGSPVLGYEKKGDLHFVPLALSKKIFSMSALGTISKKYIHLAITDSVSQMAKGANLQQVPLNQLVVEKVVGITDKVKVKLKEPAMEEQLNSLLDGLSASNSIPDPQDIKIMKQLMADELSKIETETEVGGGPVKLAQATSLYQKVHGTSKGSVYHCIALGPVNVAARISGSKVSLRVEGPEIAKITKTLQACGLTLGNGYFSVHVSCKDKIEIRRFLASMVYGFGVQYTHVVKDFVKWPA